MQLPWNGNASQTATDNPAVQRSRELTAGTSLSAAPAITKTSGPLKSNWTEHTSPDGYKYYYNSSTGESKVSFLASMWFLVGTFLFLLNIVAIELTVGKT